MAKSSFRASGVASIAGAASTAISVFVVFRLGVTHIGTAQVGVWALVQGLFLFSRVADSGMSVNLTRRLALARQSGNARVSPYVIAGLLGGTLPVAALAAASFWPVLAYVSSRADGVVTVDNITTLCFLCVAFAVTSSAATSAGALCDGAWRIVERNLVLVMSNVCLCVVMAVSVQRIGVVGFAVAYCCAAAIQLLGNLVLLLVLERGVVREHTALSVLQMTWRENGALIGVAGTRLSFEPVTKVCLSLAAPLSFVATFDLALKVTTQVRVLLQAATQPLVAFTATESAATMTPGRQSVFQRADSVLIWASLASLEALAALALALSVLGLGSINLGFVSSLLLLATANALNAAGLSGYFRLVSAGKFRTLLKIQVVMAVGNVGVGTLGQALGWKWMVVAGYGAVMAFGGLALRSHAMGSRQPGRRRALAVGSLRLLAVVIVTAGVVALHSEVAAAFTISLAMAALLAAIHLRSGLRLVAETRAGGEQA